MGNIQGYDDCIPLLTDQSEQRLYGWSRLHANPQAR